MNRFGSFNKAKQLANLAVTERQEPQFGRQLLLDDMIAFHGKHGRWPKLQDYADGLMVCKGRPKRYGLRNLRQEAMQLLKERTAQSKRVNAAAQKIEMELAGTARR